MMVEEWVGKKKGESNMMITLKKRADSTRERHSFQFGLT